MRRLLSFVLPLATACGSAGGFIPDDAGVRDTGIIPTTCSAQSPRMTFFFTKDGARSGNLGGLAGADQICAQAAAASGSTRGNWRAYLSSLDDPTFGRVNARDRIGPGPWYNYCGDRVGDLDSIHGQAGIAANLMRAQDGFEITQNMNATLFERGHDILTGSDEGGNLVGGAGPNDPPSNCADWTSSSASDVAIVGHEDTDFSSGTWNFAHATDGCDEASLAGNLGIGRIYCFSTDVVVIPDAGFPDRDGGVDPDSGPSPDGEVRDGEVRDGEPRDGDPQDAQPTDADPTDAGVRDTGTPRDGGTPDAGVACPSAANMSFFFTEQGSGPMGGDLGGLVGADAICQAAATRAGRGARTWRAYLSTLADATYGRVDARTRIGAGPWFNWDGVSIGNLAFIHHQNGGTGIAANLQKSECGYEITQNMSAGLFARAHDIFTGSDESGFLFGGSGPGDPPLTCNDWTSSDPGAIGWVGHEDTDFSSGTWNSAHSTNGCDQTSLGGTLAIGRIYCFAIN